MRFRLKEGINDCNEELLCFYILQQFAKLRHLQNYKLYPPQSSEDAPVTTSTTTRRVLNEIKWVFNLNCEGGNNIRINNTKIDSKGIKSSLTLISDEMLCLANGITF